MQRAALSHAVATSCPAHSSCLHCAAAHNLSPIASAGASSTAHDSRLQHRRTTAAIPLSSSMLGSVHVTCTYGTSKSPASPATPSKHARQEILICWTSTRQLKTPRGALRQNLTGQQGRRATQRCCWSKYSQSRSLCRACGSGQTSRVRSTSPATMHAQQHGGAI